MKRDQVIEFIKRIHVGYLATVSTDNTPRVRPISMHTGYNGDIYFFTFSTTRKVAEMEGSSQVEAVWSNLKNLHQVRIRGNAVLVEDKAVHQRFKDDDPKVASMLPPGTGHLFRLYKIEPKTVEAAEGLVPYQQIDW
jgi:uncharacterized pyridoxamine 5'-phosphate oxidase family protein